MTGKESNMETLQKRGLPGSVLKWIAVITMLIDHVGVVLIYGWARYRHAWGAGIESLNFYYAFRVIGRFGFPIFCFLLVEGFRHASSRIKYFLRLLVFALLSEPCFDKAFNSGWNDPSGQNVFCTLALGLLAMVLWDWLTDGNSPDCSPLRGVAAIGSVIALGALAYRMKTDYGAMGVALIFVMYLLRENPWARDLVALGVLAAMIPFGSHWIELLAVLCFPLFHIYNGQRGRQSKYFFYVFYPAHLLLLSLLRYLLFKL